MISVGELLANPASKALKMLESCSPLGSASKINVLSQFLTLTHEYRQPSWSGDYGALHGE